MATVADPLVEHAEQRFLLNNVAWKTYEALLEE